MSVRNYEEYRAEVLEGLGATAEDLRNEPSWRAKVLEALGAEYTDEDTRNFERYRLKVLENLSGGGGGSSDFSTAEVELHYTLDEAEFTPDTVEVDLNFQYPENAPSQSNHYFVIMVLTGNDKAYPILYKGEGFCTGVTAYKNDALYISAGLPIVTGDIEMGEVDIIIKGNGTITFPLAERD